MGQQTDLLRDLALNVSCTSERHADGLWDEINPDLWRRTRNPWAVLQTVSETRLEQIASDPRFRATLDAIARSAEDNTRSPRWFERKHPKSPLSCVAYFSMEHMLSEALPLYSGGLGNVAGDQLKAANDLGVPVTAVGLLYSQGYFRQELDRNGAQRALYPYNDPEQLPITSVRDANGDWLRFSIPFPGCELGNPAAARACSLPGTVAPLLVARGGISHLPLRVPDGSLKR